MSDLQNTSDTVVQDQSNISDNEAPRIRRQPTGVYPDQTEEFRQGLSRRLTALSHVSGGPSTDPNADEFDLERFIRRALDRDAEEGLFQREIGCAFEDVRVLGSAAGVKYGKSVADVLTGPITLPKKIASMRHAKVQKRSILQGFTFSLRPGEMLLVLGRPGSGCSTFLKTVANYTGSFDAVEGWRDYDGIGPEEMAKRFSAETVYLPENDIHFPLLTVGETLEFASQSRSPSSNARPQDMTRKDYTHTVRDLLLTLFGLKHTFNTKVGGDYIRGVSGGERKRVSIAEAMTTRARIACHDNSTRGLDAGTSLEYIRSLRTFTNLMKSATCASLYQAGEQLYEEFDKVIVIMEGRQIYFGPRKLASQYFQDLGYEPHERQTSPDFLISVTDKFARQIRKDFKGRVPESAEDLAEAYRQSDIYKHEYELVKKLRGATESGQKEEFHRSFKDSAKAEKAKHVGKKSSYNISYPMQVRLAIKRRAQLLKGDMQTQIIGTVVATFQALIIGSVFFNITKTTAGFFSRGGVIFFAILYNALTGMAEIPALYSQRPILVRQRRYAMSRPSADAIAQTICDLPVKFITIAVFDIILYFMTQLAQTPSQFFIFLLFTYVGSLCLTTYFRMLAAITRAQSQATMLAGLSILVFVITVGYAIPRPSMHGWYKWFSISLNPLAFVFEALLANEFLHYNVPCASYIPSGTGYAGVNIADQTCATAGYNSATGLVNGPAYLAAQYTYTYSHVWRNFGIVIAFYIFFFVVQLLGTEYQKDEEAAASVVLFKRGKAPKGITSQLEGGNSDLEAGSSGSSATAVDRDEQADQAADILARPKDVFTWRNVSYEVPIKNDTRKLLDDVSGYVLPGKLTALMGASGAGKTTLLNVLAQRVTMGVVEGDMLVNGSKLPTSFQRQTGYAQQQDIHLQTSTVREALQFSALLRQPRTTPKAEKLAFVEDVIRLLEMETFAEALVGEVGSGLGVEERKKLTIGVELAAKPDLLLFLDEPTSGLDSQSAWGILMLLRRLAEHGQAILCTIHQPSAELFAQFDRLLLLQPGGKTVYFGDLGKGCSTLINYLEVNSNKTCPPDANPAEWMIEMIGASASAKSKYDWAEIWRDSDEAAQIQRNIDQLHTEYSKTSSAAEDDPLSHKTYAASFFTQMKIVTQRAFQCYWRSMDYILSKILLNILAGLWIGFTFFKASDSTSGLQVRLFAVFMSLVISNPLAQQIQPQYLRFRELYESREQPSRMYHWFVSALSSVIVEMPWNILGSTLFFLCWQWTVDLASGSSRQGYIYAVYMLFALYFSTFSQAIAALAPNAQIASVLFATLFSFVIIFCGVLQPPSLMPHFWGAWMPHLATFTYVVESMLSTSIGGGRLIHCTDSEYAIVSPPTGQTCSQYLNTYIANVGGYLGNPDATSACQFCQYRTGDEYLSTVSYSYSHRARNIGIIIAYIAFNFFLLFAATYLFRVRGKSSSVKQRTIGKSEKGPKVTNEKSANGGADQAVPQGGQGEGIADSAAERMQKVI